MCYPKGRSWQGSIFIIYVYTYIHVIYIYTYLYIYIHIYVHLRYTYICVCVYSCMFTDVGRHVRFNLKQQGICLCWRILHVCIFTHFFQKNKASQHQTWQVGAGSTNGSDPWQWYRLHNNCGRARNARGIGRQAAGREIFLNQARAR